MTADILHQTLIDFLSILPVMVAAIVVSQLVKTRLSGKKFEAFSESGRNLANASIAGMATPGPLLAYLPLLKTLKDRGLPLSIITAFITGQSMVGPARIFLELGYFGPLFLFCRMVIGFLMAVGVGACFRFLEKTGRLR
jgi:uncharacterized membrane protein YraQ (UPF0718 family)